MQSRESLFAEFMFLKCLYTHETLSSIPTLESKDDTPHNQLDDMAISPSVVHSAITNLNSE